jgi:hypothetical protein
VLGRVLQEVESTRDEAACVGSPERGPLAFIVSDVYAGTQVTNSK